MRYAILALGLIAYIEVSPVGVQSSLNGYSCTEDCSGHEVGYNWAEQNDITDESDCSGYSNSFIEGCYAYVEEESGSSGSDDGSDDESEDGEE